MEVQLVSHLATFCHEGGDEDAARAWLAEAEAVSQTFGVHADVVAAAWDALQR